MMQGWLRISKQNPPHHGEEVASKSAMKELWTAQAHLLTLPVKKSGDTKCFTYVVAWAEGQEDFAKTVATIFARRHWTVIEMLKIMRADDCTLMTAELAEQIERAKVGPDTCIIGVRCYYPSKTA